MDLGLRTTIVLPSINELIQSGIILFSAQSPPPIIFPALIVEIFVFCFLFFLKKEFLYDAVTISAAPLLALYGSSPHNGSVSLYA